MFESRPPRPEFGDGRPEEVSIGSPENLILKMGPVVRGVIGNTWVGHLKEKENHAPETISVAQKSSSPTRHIKEELSSINLDELENSSEKSAELVAAQGALQQRMRELEDRASRLGARENALRQFASNSGGDLSYSSNGSGAHFDYGDDPLTPIRPKQNGERNRHGQNMGPRGSNMMRSFPPSAGRAFSSESISEQMPAVASATEVAIAADMARTEAEMRGVKAEQSAAQAEHAELEAKEKLRVAGERLEGRHQVLVETEHQVADSRKLLSELEATTQEVEKRLLHTNEALANAQEMRTSEELKAENAIRERELLEAKCSELAAKHATAEKVSADARALLDEAHATSMIAADAQRQALIKTEEVRQQQLGLEQSLAKLAEENETLRVALLALEQGKLEVASKQDQVKSVEAELLLKATALDDSKERLGIEYNEVRGHENELRVERQQFERKQQEFAMENELLANQHREKVAKSEQEITTARQRLELERVELEKDRSALDMRLKLVCDREAGAITLEAKALKAGTEMLESEKELAGREVALNKQETQIEAAWEKFNENQKQADAHRLKTEEDDAKLRDLLMGVEKERMQLELKEVEASRREDAAARTKEQADKVLSEANEEKFKLSGRSSELSEMARSLTQRKQEVVEAEAQCRDLLSKLLESEEEMKRSVEYDKSEVLRMRSETDLKSSEVDEAAAKYASLLDIVNEEKREVQRKESLLVQREKACVLAEHSFQEKQLQVEHALSQMREKEESLLAQKKQAEESVQKAITSSDGVRAEAMQVEALQLALRQREETVAKQTEENRTFKEELEAKEARADEWNRELASRSEEQERLMVRLQCAQEEVDRNLLSSEMSDAATQASTQQLEIQQEELLHQTKALREKESHVKELMDGIETKEAKLHENRTKLLKQNEDINKKKALLVAKEEELELKEEALTHKAKKLRKEIESMKKKYDKDLHLAVEAAECLGGEMKQNMEQRNAESSRLQSEVLHAREEAEKSEAMLKQQIHELQEETTAKVSQLEQSLREEGHQKALVEVKLAEMEKSSRLEREDVEHLSEMRLVEITQLREALKQHNKLKETDKRMALAAAESESSRSAEEVAEMRKRLGQIEGKLTEALSEASQQETEFKRQLAHELMLKEAVEKELQRLSVELEFERESKQDLLESTQAAAVLHREETSRSALLEAQTATQVAQVQEELRRQTAMLKESDEKVNAIKKDREAAVKAMKEHGVVSDALKKKWEDEKEAGQREFTRREAELKAAKTQATIEVQYKVKALEDQQRRMRAEAEGVAKEKRQLSEDRDRVTQLRLEMQQSEEALEVSKREHEFEVARDREKLKHDGTLLVRARDQVAAEMEAANDSSAKARRALDHASQLESKTKHAIRIEEQEAVAKAAELSREREQSQKQVNEALKEAQKALKDARLEARSAGNAAVSKAEQIAKQCLESEKQERSKREMAEKQISELTAALRQAKMARKSEERKHMTEISKLENEQSLEKDAKAKAERMKDKFQSDLQSARQQIVKLQLSHTTELAEEKEKSRKRLEDELKETKEQMESKANAKINKLELIVSSQAEEDHLKTASAFRKGELAAMSLGDEKLKETILKHDSEKESLMQKFEEEKSLFSSEWATQSKQLDESKHVQEAMSREVKQIESEAVLQRRQFEDQIAGMRREYTDHLHLVSELKGTLSREEGRITLAHSDRLKIQTLARNAAATGLFRCLKRATRRWMTCCLQTWRQHSLYSSEQEERERQIITSMNRGLDKTARLIALQDASRRRRGWDRWRRHCSLGAAHETLVEAERHKAYVLGESEAAKRLEHTALEMEEAAAVEAAKVQDALDALNKAKADAVACSQHSEALVQQSQQEYYAKKQHLEVVSRQLQEERSSHEAELEAQQQEFESMRDKLVEEEQAVSKVMRETKLEKQSIEDVARAAALTRQQGEETAERANQVLIDCRASETALKLEMEQMRREYEEKYKANEVIQTKNSQLLELERQTLEKESVESRRILEEVRRKETELETRTLTSLRESLRRERRCEELEAEISARLKSSEVRQTSVTEEADRAAAWAAESTARLTEKDSRSAALEAKASSLMNEAARTEKRAAEASAAVANRERLVEEKLAQLELEKEEILKKETQAQEKEFLFVSKLSSVEEKELQETRKQVELRVELERMKKEVALQQQLIHESKLQFEEECYEKRSKLENEASQLNDQHAYIDAAVKKAVQQRELEIEDEKRELEKKKTLLLETQSEVEKSANAAKKRIEEEGKKVVAAKRQMGDMEKDVFRARTMLNEEAAAIEKARQEHEQHVADIWRQREADREMEAARERKIAAREAELEREAKRLQEVQEKLQHTESSSADKTQMLSSEEEKLSERTLQLKRRVEKEKKKLAEERTKIAEAVKAQEVEALSLAKKADKMRLSERDWVIARSKEQSALEEARRQVAEELARATTERTAGEQAAARLRQQFEEVKALAVSAAEEEQARLSARGGMEQAVLEDRAMVAEAARTLKSDATALQVAKEKLEKAAAAIAQEKALLLFETSEFSTEKERFFSETQRLNEERLALEKERHMFLEETTKSQSTSNSDRLEITKLSDQLSIANKAQHTMQEKVEALERAEQEAGFKLINLNMERERLLEESEKLRQQLSEVNLSSESNISIGNRVLKAGALSFDPSEGDEHAAEETPNHVNRTQPALTAQRQTQSHTDECAGANGIDSLEQSRSMTYHDLVTPNEKIHPRQLPPRPLSPSPRVSVNMRRTERAPVGNDRSAAVERILLRMSAGNKQAMTRSSQSVEEAGPGTDNDDMLGEAGEGRSEEDADLFMRNAPSLSPPRVRWGEVPSQPNEPPPNIIKQPPPSRVAPPPEITKRNLERRRNELRDAINALTAQMTLTFSMDSDLSSQSALGSNSTASTSIENHATMTAQLRKLRAALEEVELLISKYNEA